MHRRDLLQFLGTTALLPFVPRSAERAFAFGQSVHRAASATAVDHLAPADAELVISIADLILPRTDTPGALDARVPAFIDYMLAAWYPADERDQMLAGFKAIDSAAGGSFVRLSQAEQVTLLTRLDTGNGPAGSAEWATRRIKSLTVYGYFTSELVVKTVTKDPIMPGKFEGCVPAR